MSIQPVGSCAISTPASPAASVGWAILTFLFRRVFAAPLPVIEMPAGKITVGSEPKSVFSEGQRQNYFRFDTTNSQDVDSLPPSEKETYVKKENMLMASLGLDPSSKAVIKIDRAITTAEDYCEQAQKASLFDRPLFYNRARSILWGVIELGHLPVSVSLKDDFEKLHHDIMLKEAVACQKAAEKTNQVQSKLEFLFSGIRALGLQHGNLLISGPRRVFPHFDYSAHHKLGAELWKKAASILESLPDDTALDMTVFADIIHSDRPFVFSPKHAAARCYFNLGQMINLIQGRILALQKKEEDISTLRLAKEIKDSCAIAHYLLQYEVKPSEFSSDEDQAWFFAERIEVASKCADSYDDMLTDAGKAIQLFQTAASKDKKTPLKYLAPIVSLSIRAHELSENLSKIAGVAEVCRGEEIASYIKLAAKYQKLTNEYIHTIARWYPKVKLSKIQENVKNLRCTRLE